MPARRQSIRARAKSSRWPSTVTIDFDPAVRRWRWLVRECTRNTTCMASNNEEAPVATDAQAKPAFVVAIGSSAGGLEPLEEWFRAMTQRMGTAFVVIQHLSPDAKAFDAGRVLPLDDAPGRDGPARPAAGRRHDLFNSARHRAARPQWLLRGRAAQAQRHAPDRHVHDLVRRRLWRAEHRGGVVGSRRRRIARSARHPRSGRLGAHAARGHGQVRRHAPQRARYGCGRHLRGATRDPRGAAATHQQPQARHRALTTARRGQARRHAGRVLAAAIAVRHQLLHLQAGHRHAANRATHSARAGQ